ncbi:MAG: hypothetical protein GX091_02165 [Peptococcaceae bacterium]|nr:hypothetical protein [Peptococcaceae bacterium]
MAFQEIFPITLTNTESGNEVIANVTGTVDPSLDFVVLVDAAVERALNPGTIEHFFVAKKYDAGTWPADGDTFNIAISPALDTDDTVTATAYAAYTLTTTP